MKKEIVVTDHQIPPDVLFTGKMMFYLLSIPGDLYQVVCSLIKSNFSVIIFTYIWVAE